MKLGHFSKSGAAAVCVLALLAGSAAAQDETEDFGQELLETIPGVKTMQNAKEAVQKRIDSVKDYFSSDEDEVLDQGYSAFDEEQRRRERERENAARQEQERIARLQRMTPEAREWAADACYYSSSGRTVESCDAEHLLPVEATAKREQRLKDRSLAANDKLIKEYADMAARDTVLVKRIERECTDYANPGNECIWAAQDADRLEAESGSG